MLSYIFGFWRVNNEKIKEQKEHAVKRYLSGEIATAITTEMGISRSVLYLWVKQFREKKSENVISVLSYKRLQE